MLETTLAILFWSMILIGASSIFLPWRFLSRFSRLLIHLPVLLFLLYLAYEYLMPSKYNIRVDLLLLYPLIIISAICYLIRLGCLFGQRWFVGRNDLSRSDGSFNDEMSPGIESLVEPDSRSTNDVEPH